MGHADTERSNGITPPVYMSVILDQRMTMQVHVPFTIMVVRMHMPAVSDQSHPEYHAQEHEHHRPAQQQYHCMSEPPTESNHAGGAERGPLREHRGYGSYMVSVQGVAKPQYE